jgi:hypothetical protein
MDSSGRARGPTPSIRALANRPAAMATERTMNTFTARASPTRLEALEANTSISVGAAFAPEGRSVKGGGDELVAMATPSAEFCNYEWIATEVSQQHRPRSSVCQY